MRVLVLLRGVPGSGKSTFLKKYELGPYAISPDKLRLLYSCPVMNKEGKFEISQKNDQSMWELVVEKLKSRMEKGELIVVDAVNSTTSILSKYKNLSEQHRYRVFCVDHENLPLEVALQRNAQREEYKRVPESVISRMYQDIIKNKIPSWIERLPIEDLESGKIDFWKAIEPTTFDYSNYKKIVHIGDIQGCIVPLKQYFEENPINPETLYIFTGDLLDRGPNNGEVLQYMLQIYDLPNVILVEGNHDRFINIWSKGGTSASLEFELRTRPQLEAANISPKAAQLLYRKTRQMVKYKYFDKTVLVSHGGLPLLPENMVKIPTFQLIHGAGDYGDHSIVDANFAKNTEGFEYYQIHGHRNSNRDYIQVNQKCFNLEGQVEFNGDLRIVELTKDGFKTVLISNVNEQLNTEKIQNSKIPISQSGLNLISSLRANDMIKEKQHSSGISSFNFKRSVFYGKSWDEQTVRARGLFINTYSGEIVARSYNKFFNVDEMPETKQNVLRKNLQYPVSVFEKYNGYLGILGFDNLLGRLVFCSKSTMMSEFAVWFEQEFDKIVNKEAKVNISKYLQSENKTMVFEVIKPTEDPHIVKYDQSQIVLLDVISRKENFEKLEYNQLLNVGKVFGLKVKSKAENFEKLENAEDFDRFLELCANIKSEDFLSDTFLEGYVLEDSTGFLTKLKLPIYQFWKDIRTQVEILHKMSENKTLKEIKLKKDPKWVNNVNFYEELLKFIENNPKLWSKSVIEIREEFKDHLKANIPPTPFKNGE